VSHKTGQSAFLPIHSCIYLRILNVSYSATFLGTCSLSVLMCRKAINQSIVLLLCTQGIATVDRCRKTTTTTADIDDRRRRQTRRTPSNDSCRCCGWGSGPPAARTHRRQAEAARRMNETSMPHTCSWLQGRVE